MFVTNVSELAQMRLYYYFGVTQKLKTDNIDVGVDLILKGKLLFTLKG